MNGLPTPEKLAELTALSRALNAVGAPHAVTLPVVLGEHGYVFGLCPDDKDGTIGAYLHSGLRVAWAPMPIQNGLLLSIWGGLGPEPGYEEEGVTAFMTRDGLRRFAADLVAIADASEPA